MNHFIIVFLIAISTINGCDGCMKDYKERAQQRKEKIAERKRQKEEKAEPIIHEKKTIVKMEKQNGINVIPVEIDGVKMNFIFDTGASTISISGTEASFLYKQGLLTDNDIRGKEKYLDANGNISEGTTINLKTVKIGERILTNVDANVVHNLNAPLLFGQSALSKFGKISIDNNRGEVTFE